MLRLSYPHHHLGLRRVLGGAVLLLVGLSQTSLTWRVPTGYRPEVDLIVLDAGHGGKDPGTHGRSAREKDVALKVVLLVEKRLKENQTTVGIRPLLTRRSDVFIDLAERAAIANRNKADAFISVHCNANPNRTVNGSETYAMGLHKEDDNLTVMKENSSILLEEDHEQKYDGFDPNSPEAYIIFSLMQNAYLKQSLQLAGNVERNFKSLTKRPSRGVKQAGFLVLWRSSMPSVLIEIGFLSHSAEERFLASAAGQQFVADAIYRAIKEYKSPRR